MKKAMKTHDGLAHILAVLAEEESNNAALVASLLSTTLPPPASSPPPEAPTAPPPHVASVNTAFNNLATKVKLHSILKNKSK